MADGKPSPALAVAATPTAPAAAASASGRVLNRQDSTSAAAAGSFDAWLAQKLKSEWSADELGALLTRERLADARASFPQLETPVKARLLLSFLSVRPEEAADCREAIGDVLALAEADGEEWVRMSAGMVRQFQFMDADGAPGDSFFHAQLAKTARAIVDAVASPKDSRERTLDDFLSLENALLNPSIRADVALAPAKHFTVLAPPPDANGKSSDREARQPKKPLHRPQMARPLLHPSSTSSTSAAAPTRLTPPSAKQPAAPKKNVSDVTSEIRRKADAGRFKRQRSRISMIDIDEVKQIESEKAQKAEERKKQKLLAKEKEKAAAAVAGVSASGKADAASDNAGEEASPPNASASGRDDSSADTTADASAAYEEHSDQQDTVSEDEQSGSAEASGHADADYEQVAHGGLYAADGARALLNAAAFHSSQDEAIHQEHLEQQQPQLPSYQPPAYHPQHALPPPPQFQQRGFEPEDAGSHLGFSGYGFGGQSSSSNSNSAGYFGDQVGAYRPQEASPYGGVYMSDPRQAPVPGNAAVHGFFPDQRGAFDPNAQRQQQQQQQQQQQPRQPLGGFLDGPPEYWR